MRQHLTIKDWFFDHPNITFLLLGAWALWLIAITIQFFEADRWGWAALGLLASCVAVRDAQNWWRDRL